MQKVEFSKPELVTIAVALLGGDTTHIDREDVALKVNDIAPGQFNWRKYPERIDLDAVGGQLRNAKKPQKGGLVVGNNTKGWMLSPAGLKRLVLPCFLYTYRPAGASVKTEKTRNGAVLIRISIVGNNDRCSLQTVVATPLGLCWFISLKID